MHYHTWSNEKEKREIFSSKTVSQSIESYGGVSQGYLRSRESYDYDGSKTIRSQYNSADYYYHKNLEEPPKKLQDSIFTCNQVYNDNGLVRSVIDMMADFTVQGLRVEHRDPKIQSFINEWMKYVDFNSVSERISNTLYRIANCPIYITYGQVGIRNQREWSKADTEIREREIKNKRIPLNYNILNPLSIEVIGGDNPILTNTPTYGIKVTHSMRSDMQILINSMGKMNLTTEDQKKILLGQDFIPLKEESLVMLYYKKDSWLKWSRPMIHSILKPLFTLEKMRLADNKALDGAISQIRLWTLGSFDHNIYPTEAGINKLRSILSNVGTGETMDVIWGPELSFKESDSKAYNFLKSDKYDQVMKEIYSGLGVPPSLTGGQNTQSSNNNSVSMKTLIERLEYGRRILQRFWEEQFSVLKTALKWKHSAVISFDYKVLSDENLERKILIDLWDRNVISTEKLRQLCGRDPKLEELRVRSEHKKIENGTNPMRSSPYHNPNINAELKKIILNQGGVAPSEVGLTLKKKKDGEETNLERVTKLTPKNVNSPTMQKKTGGDGRPFGSKDSSKRIRNEKPRRSTAQLSSFISLFNWANDIQEELGSKLSTLYLNELGKTKLTSLTRSEADIFESLKLSVLCSMKPYEELTDKSLAKKLKDKSFDDDILLYIEGLKRVFESTHDRQPTIKELRQINSSAYAVRYENGEV